MALPKELQLDFLAVQLEILDWLEPPLQNRMVALFQGQCSVKRTGNGYPIQYITIMAC